MRIDALAEKAYVTWAESDGTKVGEWYAGEDGAYMAPVWAELSEATRERWRAVAELIQNYEFDHNVF